MKRIGDWVKHSMGISRVGSVGDEFITLDTRTGMFSPRLGIVTVRDFFKVIEIHVPATKAIQLGSFEWNVYVGVVDTYMNEDRLWCWHPDVGGRHGLWPREMDHILEPDISRLPLADVWSVLPDEAKQLFLTKVGAAKETSE